MTENRSNKLVIPERVGRALASVERAAGGRLKLVEELSDAQLTPEMEYVAGLIADPRNDTKSLAHICHMADMSVGRFLKLLGDAKMSKAVLEAQGRVAKLLPDVAEDVMQRSIPQTFTCDECGGSGEVEVVVRGGATESAEPTRARCDVCRGKGEITHVPSLERQKVALELGGMLQRGGGVQVGVQVNTPGGMTPALTTSEKFRGATDRLMYPSAQEPPVEAEMVEEKEDDAGVS